MRLYTLDMAERGKIKHAYICCLKSSMRREVMKAYVPKYVRVLREQRENAKNQMTRDEMSKNLATVEMKTSV